MLHVKVFTFNAFAENTYVLYTQQGNAIIIDAGCYTSAEQNMLKDFLQQQNLQVVKHLNTHCHLDHVFGTEWVYNTFKLDLHIHAQEKQVLDFAAVSGQKWGIPVTTYTGGIQYLQEGDVVELDGNTLQVLFTPGHSPGSICFYCAAQNFVIGGDVLFYESIGRTDLPGGNHETLLQSIREKLFVLPNETIVYNGHGEATTIGHEKNFNPFL